MTLTHPQLAQLVTMLEEGKTRTNILIRFDIEGDELTRIALAHGFGFNAANGRAQRVAKPRQQAPSPISPAPQHLHPVPAPPPTLAPSPTSAPKPHPEPTMAAPVRPTDANLVSEGLHHQNVKVRTLAGRAQEVLDKLAAAIDEADEKAEALAKVQRLAAELKDARAALRSTSGTRSAKAGDPGGNTARAAILTRLGVTEAEVRKWASGQPVALKARGRLSLAVLQAYEEAHR